MFVDARGKGPPAEAVESCRLLGVNLAVIPAVEQFERLVKEPSMNMLEKGLTPNPCAMCNARVKLALPFNLLRNGETLVTGHYARNREGLLESALDRKKDQSYFLSLVPGSILRRCAFPLGGMTKAEVREQVRLSGLPFLERESQDLCFELKAKGEPGDIVDSEGNPVGRHSGLDGYTPGQRKGIGAHGGRKYVLSLDRKRNAVIIGNPDGLYSGKCIIDTINWLERPEKSTFQCHARLRYRKPPVPATVAVSGYFAEVVFEKPQAAVSPGQVCALYTGDVVICGGIISAGQED